MGVCACVEPQLDSKARPDPPQPPTRSSIQHPALSPGCILNGGLEKEKWKIQQQSLLVGTNAMQTAMQTEQVSTLTQCACVRVCCCVWPMCAAWAMWLTCLESATARLAECKGEKEEEQEEQEEEQEGEPVAGRWATYVVAKVSHCSATWLDQ